MTPLQTKYEITVPVDDKEFKLFYTPLSFEQIEKLNKDRQKITDANIPIDELNTKLVNINNKINLNNNELQIIEELLKDADEKEKKALIQEKRDFIKDQRALVEEVGVLTDELRAAVKNKPATPNINWGEKRFDLCISGENKEEFRDLIKDSIGYTKVLKTIDEIVNSESEKK